MFGWGSFLGVVATTLIASCDVSSVGYSMTKFKCFGKIVSCNVNNVRLA